ncbi:MAG TPA: UDP-N-acetylmuramoyl-L-alanyl-D-glutamate--2,6-diaminopimelate ligase [Dongiaceae bacterium]|nr:UDP-N-acetylmuramoyl-L-alanyl-D-glutamate--2,6-diaminopimelate ligase [Dongiaceae bacterium]
MNIRRIVKTLIPTSLFRRIEPTGHLLEAMLMNARYGFPGRHVRVIGVTGTNGKTTTSLFIYQLLHSAGLKVAFMSTVATGMNGEVNSRKIHMTTTNAGDLQRSLRDFGKAGIEWVIVETSSHALAQHRVWGVPYEIAVMTNITHDHLEYHGTFENYRAAKRSLFTLANKRGLRFGVVNADDPSAQLFVDAIAHSTTYGIKGGDLQAKSLKLKSTGSTYKATVNDDTYDISINIPGEFNVSNSLAALAVGRKLGLTKQQIEKGLAALTSVEGRMNAIKEGQPFQVIVDFASTPDGFEKFFASIRPLVKGKLVAVFGSAGRRDESKRAAQGAIAAAYADEVIATEEDDRDEDGTKILEQIAEGAVQKGKVRDETLFLIPNREEAIGFALTRVAGKDDAVVLLGKGHEKTIERKDGDYPWNEAEVAREALRALQAESKSVKR